MTTSQWMALLLAALTVFWMVGAYNRLVRLRHAIVSAWQQVDEQLQRRAAALPALLAALEVPLDPERPALDAVAAAQKRSLEAAAALRPKPLADAASQLHARLLAALASLDSALSRLLALLDQQPALRDGPEVAALRRELHDIDLRLAIARQLFTDASAAYRAAAHQWPTALLTRAFGFADPGAL
jgi:LemA protein